MAAAPKVSLVVGSAGQDGHYLSALLRARGDEVIGLARTSCESSQAGPLGAVDITEREQVARLLLRHRPAEVYYLAAAHGAAEAARDDDYGTFERCEAVHVRGWLHFLDAVARQGAACRLFYAASSLVFGDPTHSPQTERTPLAPVCFYGVTKATGIGLARRYRREASVFCSAGILYNHESPRRPLPFVSRKLARAAAEVKLGRRERVTVGSLAAIVDWGAAEDYVEAMTRILALERAEDFVIASGTPHTVRDFAETAFAAVGLPWERHVTEDRAIVKSAQRSVPLIGDATRLREATGWQPMLSFQEMVRRMVEAELAALAP
jgi:GDPmannose 4,6-dehydratase